MSCEKCGDEQERVFLGIAPVAYYRWNNANVAIIGCSEHVAEIINYL